MVSDDPTAPQPLDAEQVAALGRDWRTMPTERARDVVALVATVEQLQAEVEARKEVDRRTTTLLGEALEEGDALRAEVDRLTADLAQRPVIYARTCDDCPGGTDWQQRAEQAEADLAATTSQRDAATELVREVLEQITTALGLPLTEAGRPRNNAFLFREIGKFIECDEWDWPTGARAAQPQEGTPGGHQPPHHTR